MGKSSYNYETVPEDSLEGILPCPFCGSFHPEKQNFLAKVTDKQGWKSISCSGCGCNPSTAVHSWEAAIAQWNSRISFSDTDEFLRGVEWYKRYLMDIIIGVE
jgi:hypothetical protein